MDHELRRARLAARLDELQLDGLLVTRLPNVRYLTGFTGSNGQLLARHEGSVFLTDGRYGEQAAHEVPDLLRVVYQRGLGSALEPHTQEMRRIGFEAHDLTVASHRRLDGALGAELVATEHEVERFRWVKDEEELGLLRAAQEATDRAFDQVLGVLAVGVSELEMAQVLELEMRRAGAEAPAFDPIVAFGGSAAEPHHAPGHRALREGDVVKMDFGARIGGYHADMTRTVSFGEPPPELRKIHDLVRQAQQAGIDTARAGVASGAVDGAARSVIAAAGYGERFTHPLGHGVGLEIHEGPSLRPDGDDLLPVGAVVTVEPGVYVAGLGGVRIEDMVEVTPDGCHVLGTSSRELIEL